MEWKSQGVCVFFVFFSEVFDIYCFEQDAVRMKSQPAYQKYSETSIEVVGYCCSEKCSALFQTYASSLVQACRLCLSLILQVRSCTLRGQLQIKFAKKPLDISEVEPASEIVKRFATGRHKIKPSVTKADKQIVNYEVFLQSTLLLQFNLFLKSMCLSEIVPKNQLFVRQLS